MKETKELEINLPALRVFRHTTFFGKTYVSLLKTHSTPTAFEYLRKYYLQKGYLCVRSHVISPTTEYYAIYTFSEFLEYHAEYLTWTHFDTSPEAVNKRARLQHMSNVVSEILN